MGPKLPSGGGVEITEPDSTGNGSKPRWPLVVEWEEEIRDLQLQVGLHPERLHRKCTSFGFGRAFLIYLHFRKLLVFPPHLTNVETKAELLHDFYEK